jgi:hypothetical protein
MTQRYAHLRDEALRRASDLAGDLLNQVMNGSALKRLNLGSKCGVNRGNPDPIKLCPILSPDHICIYYHFSDNYSKWQ